MKRKDMKKKVESHLRDDIETFREEASEDKDLIKSLKGSKNKNSKMKHGPLVKAVAAKMKKKKK